jgi:IS30 family transposase
MKFDLGKTISHEAIYQYIYAQIHRDGWGYLRPGHEDLRPYLRRRRKRRLRKGARRCQRVFKPKGASINERPPVVAELSRVGDWEGNTVESINHKPGVNTLVERKTGLFLITKLCDRTSQATNKVVATRLNALPAHARHSLTLDNGPENQDWQTLESRTNLRCFFAHPYHSWERGSNENTNSLLRDYFPKKTDFTIISEEDLAHVEHELNTRPRKRLGWKNPLEVFNEQLMLHLGVEFT